MHEKEIWKDIPGYEGLYQVNQWGDIYSLYTHKKLKWSLHKDGYKQYNLHKNKKSYIMTAHRSVALAFIPNPDNLPKEFYVYDFELNLLGKFKGTRKFAKKYNLSSRNFSSILNYNSKNPIKLRQYKGFYPIFFKL